MKKKKARGIGKKLFLYVCICTIVFSNISLALPSMNAFAEDIVPQPESTEPVTEDSSSESETETTTDTTTNTPTDTTTNVEPSDYTQLPQLLITEMMPNNNSTDDYEYFEVYNNSNQPIVLDYYTFLYRYTDGSDADKKIDFAPVTVAPKETMVFWNNVKNKSMDEFNTHYKTNLTNEEIVSFSGITNFSNTGNRGMVIMDQQGNEIASNSYLAEDIDSGLVVQYQYPLTGIDMGKFQVKAQPTPGTVDSNQVPEQEVALPNNEAPIIEHTPITEVSATEDVKITAKITDDQPVVATLYYQNGLNANYEPISMTNKDGSTYEAVIEKEKLLSDKVSYYITVIDANNRVSYPKDPNIPIEITIKGEVEVDYNSYPPLIITELSPNSAGTDNYEYIELYNNTNQPINLANYSFVYAYTDGSKPDLPFQIPATTIEPQKTLVLWFNNGNLTLADFNTKFGTNLAPEQVIEFKDVFPGFANGGNRALIIKDSSGAAIVSASYLGTETDNNGAGIEYKYPLSGTEMDKYKVLTVPTPGTIEAAQAPETPVSMLEPQIDTETPVINHTAVTNSSNYAPIKIEATITDNLAVPTATLYYKLVGEESFKSVSMNASAEDATKYEAEIPDSAVQSNMIYYIEATDGMQSSKTEEYTITVEVNDDNMDYSKMPIFLVTEVVPDSTNVGGADGYEYIEVYNNTNQDLNFKDYKINYRYGADPLTDVIWPSTPDDVVIPSKGTLVFWIINKANTASTVADFNANYGTNLVENKDIVRIYSDGMSNSAMRGLVVSTNAKEEISVSYYYDTQNDDTQSNKGIVFKYPEDGSTTLMKLSAGIEAATPGAVDQVQVPKQAVQLQTDSIPPTIENMTKTTEVNQTENIGIAAKVTDNIEVKSVRLFYRTNSEGKYKEVILPLKDLYEYTIPYAELIAKKEVEYYFVASDGTNETTSDSYKIKVNSEYDHSSLRLNVKDGEIFAGETILRGTSQTDSANGVKMFLDHSEMTNNLYNSLEHDAYFAYEVSGINVFFQNGVTMGEDILHIFDETIVDWETITVPIDVERLQVGDNIITVRAGNKASPFQLDESEENRDDFNIRNARLVLPDGTILRDPAKSNPTQVFDMGDDGFYRPFEDFTFTLTDDQAPSKTYKWDTTEVADGEHVITVKDVDEDVSVKVLVDNTAPVIETNIEDGTEYKGEININVNATDTIAGVESVKVMLDNQEISQSYQTSSSQLSAGEHTLTMTAIDKVGNQKEQTIQFTVVDENPNEIERISPTDESEIGGNPTLQVKVTDPTEDDLDVTFYQGYKYDTNRPSEVKAFKNASDIEPPQTMVPAGETEFSTEDMSLVSKVDGQYLMNNSSTQFPYHRFEVTVDSAVDENDVVELVWKGKSLEGRKVSMYAWNHQTNKWTLINYKIAGSFDFELKGNVEVADFVKDHKINVLIQDEIPSSPSEYDYTLVWMSDTQYYSESYPHIYQRQTDWIAEKKDELKIKYVFHTGDLVDEHDKLYQWENADKSMQILEDYNIPYGVLAGNHDVNHTEEDYTEYYKWFGANRFEDKPFYGESYKNNRGHYDLISAQGNDYIMLYMGWGVTEEDIQWMSDILNQYPDRLAILSFHEYLLVSGNRSPLGDQIYSELVKPHSNVMAVLSGHYHDSEALISDIDDNGDGKADRQVYQMLADYQGGPEGGQGFLRLLHIDQDTNRIIVNTYSPYLDKYNFYDTTEFPGKDEFTINLDLQVKEKQVATDYFAVNIYSDTEIGKKEAVKSGSNVEMKWEGLSENTLYSWYAIAEDEYTGRMVSDIWTFTKGAGSEMETSKTYNLKNYKTKKLVIETPFSVIDLDETSTIHEGIVVKTSATLKGTGLKNTKVVINPAEENAVLDLSGVEVKEIQIDSSQIKEIRGAENVQKWTISNGVDKSKVNAFHSNGEKINITQ